MSVSLESSPDESRTRKRKKKSHKAAVEEAEHSKSDDVDFSPSPPKKKKARSKENEAVDQSVTKESNNTNGVKLGGTSWPTEDVQTLFERMESQLPVNDVMKYTKRLEKINWESVTFNNYSADDCHTKFSNILKRVMQTQTVHDVMLSVKSVYVRRPWVFSAVPLKKPLTAYLLYHKDKQKKFHKKNPGLNQIQVTRLIADKYKKLSARKKEKYFDRYKANMETYKEDLLRLKEENPSMVTPDLKRPTCKTPSALFTQKKIEKLMEENPDLTRKEAYTLASQKWKKLKDRKKLKWIKRSVQTFDSSYKNECEVWKAAHPNFVPRDTCLNKHEADILVKSGFTWEHSVPPRKVRPQKDKPPRKKVKSQKMKKPPSSGYSLFSRRLLKELTDVPGAERMAEVGRRWKELEDEEKRSYSDEAKALMVSYQQTIMMASGGKTDASNTSGAMDKRRYSLCPNPSTSKDAAPRSVTSTASSKGTRNKSGKHSRNAVKTSTRQSTSRTSPGGRRNQNIEGSETMAHSRTVSSQTEYDVCEEVKQDVLAELSSSLIDEVSQIMSQNSFAQQNVTSEMLCNDNISFGKKEQTSHAAISPSIFGRLRRRSKQLVDRRVCTKPSTKAVRTRCRTSIHSASHSFYDDGEVQFSNDQENCPENTEPGSSYDLLEGKHCDSSTVNSVHITRKNVSSTTIEEDSLDRQSDCSRKHVLTADILDKEVRICLPRIDHVLDRLVEIHSKQETQKSNSVESVPEESIVYKQKENTGQNLSVDGAISQMTSQNGGTSLVFESSKDQAGDLQLSMEPCSDADSPVLDRKDCLIHLRAKMSHLFDLSMSTPEVFQLKQKVEDAESGETTVNDAEDSKNFSSLSTQEPLSIFSDFQSSGSQVEVSQDSTDEGSLRVMPCSIIDQCQRIYQGLGKDHVGEASAEILACLSTTKEESDAIEENTRLQVACDAWYFHRRGRLTASIFSNVANLGNSTARRASLLKKILQDVRYPSSTWGLDHEQRALTEYYEKIKEHHQNVRVWSCGFVINPAYPHLGATPDSWVECDCCGKGVVEVKCPVSFPAFKVGDSNRCSFSLLSPHKKGLPLCENALAQEHGYFYQVQGQMAVCDVNFCDFICWTPNSIHVERIQRDREFFNILKEDLDLFYVGDVIPAIVSDM